MSVTQPTRLEADVLRRIADGIEHIGVVANDGDLQFDVKDAHASLAALQAHMRSAGYTAGELTVNKLIRPHEGVDTLIYDKGRHGTPMEAEQAWERDYRARWHDHVETCADDWIERLGQLRAQMETSLQDPDFGTLSIVDQAPVPMFEELMRRFGVSPRLMPTFEIRAGNRRVMRFQPKGLWIIGANGRVDLITKAAAPILIDQSEPLSSQRDWRLYESNNHGRSVPLTPDTFRDLVRAGL